MNIIRNIRPPVGVTAAQLISGLGASCRIHIQRAATETGAFSDLSGTNSTPFITIASTDTEWTGYDPSGLSSSWYRTRFENSDGTIVNDWQVRQADYG